MQGIDTVVLNHAYFGHLTLWSGTEKELKMFEKMSGINYHSYVHIASHALPYIKSAEKGRLGVVSSTAGIINILGDDFFRARSTYNSKQLKYYFSCKLNSYFKCF